MAADLSHLLSVDTKKHKYEKTVKDICNLSTAKVAREVTGNENAQLGYMGFFKTQQYQGSLLAPQVSMDLKDIGTDVYGTEG